jgi:hypothetical protein
MLLHEGVCRKPTLFGVAALTMKVGCATSMVSVVSRCDDLLVRATQVWRFFVFLYQRVIEFSMFLCAMTLKKCCELCVIPLVERTEASILLPFTGGLRRSTALERCLPPGKHYRLRIVVMIWA